MKRSGECGACRDSPRNPECRGRMSLDASFDLDAHFIVKTAMDLQALMSFVFEVTEKWSKIGYQRLPDPVENAEWKLFPALSFAPALVSCRT